jgi:hypothetical protein
MIYDACTLVSPAGTLALGAVTHTPAGTSGFTVEVNTAAAPLVIYRQELRQAPGGIVVPGRRGPREVVISGQVLGVDRNDLAERWAELLGFLTDLDGELLGVQVTVPAADIFTSSVTRVMYGAIDGGLNVERVTPLAEAFEVRLVCPDPVAYDTDTSVDTLAAAPGVSVTNAGDATVGATFVVAGPPSGTTTGLRVGNTTTGRKVELAGLEFEAGDELVVVTTPGREEVTLNGASIAGTVDVASRWPLLVPGTNRLYLTRTAGSGTMSGTVEWRSGWVS